MHPDYKETMDRFQFNQDDIEAIQYLYGKPSERNEIFKLSRKNRQKYLNTVRFEWKRVEIIKNFTEYYSLPLLNIEVESHFSKLDNLNFFLKMWKEF